MVLGSYGSRPRAGLSIYSKLTIVRRVRLADTEKTPD